MSKSVLCVCAHPDDEVLGCGGTIARHVANGDSVTVIFMSDGVTSRDYGPSVDVADVTRERQDACEKAMTILGVSFWEATVFPDQKFDSVPLLNIIKSIEFFCEKRAAVRDIKPQIIYTHHLGDLNADHRITAQAVLTAFRPLPGSSVEAIYGFEVPSSTEWGLDPFVPDTFVDVTSYLPRKMEALRAYDVEMREFPHPRSYEAVSSLARWRGSIAGLKLAEAFKAYRRIER